MCSITSSGSTIRFGDTRQSDTRAPWSSKTLLAHLRQLSGKPGEGQMDTSRAEAHEFLGVLDRTLGSELPEAAEMESWVRGTVGASKRQHQSRHLHLPEAAFLNGHVLPILARLIRAYPCCAAADDARRALLNEYHPSMPSLSSHSPARTSKHPFTKLLGATDPLPPNAMSIGGGGGPDFAELLIGSKRPTFAEPP
jgi:hypothetical protein